MNKKEFQFQRALGTLIIGGKTENSWDFPFSSDFKNLPIEDRPWWKSYIYINGKKFVLPDKLFAPPHPMLKQKDTTLTQVCWCSALSVVLDFIESQLDD